MNRPNVSPGGLDRRSFLVGAGAVAAATSLPRIAWGAPAQPGIDALVLVFLRGGLDGISLCSPFADPYLARARPALAMPQPGQPHGVLPLDNFFGLHPAARPLMPAYQAGQLLVVHACGSPESSRSHFEAQSRMESAWTGPGIGAASGWVARHLSTLNGAVALRGLGTSETLMRGLIGSRGVLPIREPSAFRMPGSSATVSARRKTLDRMYRGAAPAFADAAQDTFATVDLLASVDFDTYVPAGNAVYPTTPFGQQFRNTAALLKASLGVRCVEIDLHGWDHHTNLGATGGSFTSLTQQLAETLAAFRLDLGGAMSGVDVIVMSEFGRRLRPNANLGLDHGRGGCMLLLGGGVAGGRVLTQWPGLKPSNLHQGDLAITIDYRDILGEMLVRRFGCSNLSEVFPNFTPQFRGVAH